MKIDRNSLFALIFAVLLTIGFVGSAIGQEEALKDLAEYRCKDLMRLSGCDREVGIGVLHAFLLGKKGTTKYEVKKLADATDRFVEHCLDNPDDRALSVMEAMSK